MTLSLISRYTRRPPAMEDTFRDLGLDEIDRTCIADDIERTYRCELSDREVEGWHSVACIVATVERVRRVAA